MADTKKQQKSDSAEAGAAGGASEAGLIASAISSAIGAVSGAFMSKQQTQQAQIIVGGDIVKTQINAQLQADLGEQNITNNVFAGIMGIRNQSVNIKQQAVKQKQFEKNQTFYAAIFVIIVLSIIYTITILKK